MRYHSPSSTTPIWYNYIVLWIIYYIQPYHPTISHAFSFHTIPSHSSSFVRYPSTPPSLSFFQNPTKVHSIHRQTSSSSQLHQTPPSDSNHKQTLFQTINGYLSYPISIPLWDPFGLHDSTDLTIGIDPTTKLPISYLLLSIGIFLTCSLPDAIIINVMNGSLVYLGRMLSLMDDYNDNVDELENVWETEYHHTYQITDLVAFLGALVTTDLLTPTSFLPMLPNASSGTTGSMVVGIGFIGLTFLSVLLSLTTDSDTIVVQDSNGEDDSYTSPSVGLLDVWDDKFEQSILDDTNTNDR